MDGRILGGDASFYYVGTYTSEKGRWKGQILNQEHTPAMGENPIFGGHEVGRELERGDEERSLRRRGDPFGAGREVSHLQKGNFVGEVAFLTEKPATRTVWPGLTAAKVSLVKALSQAMPAASVTACCSAMPTSK